MKHRTFSVLYIDSAGRIKSGFNGLPVTNITGIDLLLQNIIIRLFTEDNAFNPEIGGNLYSIIGKGYTPGEEDLIKNDFLLAFETIEQQIKDEQNIDRTIPPSEKLKRIKLNSVEFDETDHTWEIKATIESESFSATFTVINS